MVSGSENEPVFWQLVWLINSGMAVLLTKRLKVDGLGMCRQEVTRLGPHLGRNTGFWARCSRSSGDAEAEFRYRPT